jgi:hypothetical protein
MNKVFDYKKYIEINFGLIAASVYLVLSAIKMRKYLVCGRFWAEEGTFFYSDISTRKFFDAIFFTFHGHLEIVTNLVVYASTFVSLKYAPLVTTYLSLAAQFIPICFVIRYRESLSLTRFKLVLMLIIAVGLPQASEVWANSINLHFHFCLLAALIAAIGLSDGPNKWVSRILLGVSGLSGISSNFLVPVFAFLAVSTKEKERWIQFLILVSTAFLQIVLLVSNSFQGGQREYFSTPLAFWLAPVAQSVISPLFGFYMGDKLIDVLREALNLNSGSFVLALVFSIPIIYLLVIGLENKCNKFGVMVLSVFVIMLASIFTAIGDKLMLISSSGGGRYFYASNVLLSIVVLGMAGRKNIFVVVSVLLLVFNSLGNVKRYIGGPDWRSNFEIVRNNKELTYSIWPDGWRMSVKTENLETHEKPGRLRD